MGRNFWWGHSERMKPCAAEQCCRRATKMQGVSVWDYDSEGHLLKNMVTSGLGELHTVLFRNDCFSQ